MRIGFGIDGGGTRSRLILFDRDIKKRLLETEGGPTNPHSVGFEQAADSIRQLITEGCAALGIPLQQLSCGCLGSAGFGRSPEKQRMTGFFKSFLACPVIICTDGEILMAGCLNSLGGHVLIAGTGSLALGRDPQGILVRAGGLGHMLGDEGSACWLGWQAVQRTLKSLEGRDLPTAMLSGLLAHFELSAPQDFIPFFHRQFDKKQVAAAAPFVLTMAKEQDPLAVDLTGQAAQALFDLIKSVCHQLPLTPLRIALGGGLLNNENPLSVKLHNLLQKQMPEAQLYTSKPQDAVWGACVLADSLLPFN